MARQVIADGRAPAIARQPKHLVELRADRACQEADRCSLIPIGGKFEDEVRLAHREAGQRMEAGEMHARLAVERVEPCGKLGPGGIPQRIDRRLGVCQASRVERRDDRDQRLVHGGQPLK